MNPAPSPHRTRGGFFKRCAIAASYLFAILAVLYVVAITSGYLKLYSIPTSAMAPTLTPGDHIYAKKYSPGISDLSRGQLVMFSADGMRTPDGIPLRDTWVKRIAGLPGDVIDVRDGALLVNDAKVTGEAGHALAPSAVPGGTRLSFPLTVPRDRVFLLGDNFTNSLDSRYLGPIPVSRISYRPITRVYPPGRAGKIR